MSERRRVLVTGASGFVGRHTLRPLLDRGYEVHGVCHGRSTGWSVPGVHTHRCDLLDQGQVSELVQRVAPSHLLHLAWCTRHGEYPQSPENLSWTAASLQLLLLFSQGGGARAVVAGTCAEYDWSYPLAVEGQTPLLPGTLYGAAKHALRQILERFACHVSLSLAWGRLFFPFGPHEASGRLVPSVVRPLLLGQPAHCTAGDQVRDFVYVKDAAAAFAALLDSTVTGAVNVAGEALSVKALTLLIGQQIGRAELIELGALPPRAREPGELRADLSRLRNEVGFAHRYTIAQGLQEMIAWWRSCLGTAPAHEERSIHG